MLCAGVAVFVAIPSAAQAQARPAIPGEQGLARLVWGAMVALDHANRTGNYSVLYSLGSVGFQDVNSPQKLSETFAPLRRNRVDVGRAVLIAPRYHLPPAIDDGGVLRLRGSFDFRPTGLGFDLMFEWDGGWTLLGLSVAEVKTSP